METYTLQTILDRFDHYTNDLVDWDKLDRDDRKAYAETMLRIGDECFFRKGRHTLEGEMTLELFDIPELRELADDPIAIMRLDKAQQQRITLYRDLANAFLPIYHRQVPDLTALPWNLDDGTPSVANTELYRMLSTMPQRRVVASLIYALIWAFVKSPLGNDVAQDTLFDQYRYEVNNQWTTYDEDNRPFNLSVEKTLEAMLMVVNHMELGRRLGLSRKAQYVYDLMNAYITDSYYYRQVDAARELTAWFDENWPDICPNPTQEQFDKLDSELQDIEQRYQLSFTSNRYAMSYLYYGYLGISMFDHDNETDTDEISDEEDDAADGDERWTDEENDSLLED